MNRFQLPESARFADFLAASPFADQRDLLIRANQLGWEKLQKHGDLPRWQQALAELPARTPVVIDPDRDLNRAAIRIGSATESPMPAEALESTLMQLHPWRKGPFDIFGVHIDTEWRSDLKWDRIKDAITPLAGRNVLDIGCGSGYHLWRMLGAGAERVIGIDPTALFSMQFAAVKRYLPNAPVFLLPIGIEAMPADMHCFDTLFSMGILYHRRAPIDHLLDLKSLLRPGGELVLETLVIDGDEQHCLIPRHRYAKMRNVWFIPSVAMLERWLVRAGFDHIRLVDISPTRCDEQRSTRWMQFESLADFLDPDDPARTIEGYPAPVRACLTATLPD